MSDTQHTMADEELPALPGSPLAVSTREPPAPSPPPASAPKEEEGPPKSTGLRRKSSITGALNVADMARLSALDSQPRRKSSFQKVDVKKLSPTSASTQKSSFRNLFSRSSKSPSVSPSPSPVPSPPKKTASGGSATPPVAKKGLSKFSKKMSFSRKAGQPAVGEEAKGFGRKGPSMGMGGGLKKTGMGGRGLGGMETGDRTQQVTEGKEEIPDNKPKSKKKAALGGRKATGQVGTFSEDRKLGTGKKSMYQSMTSMTSFLTPKQPGGLSKVGSVSQMEFKKMWKKGAHKSFGGGEGDDEDAVAVELDDDGNAVRGPTWGESQEDGGEFFIQTASGTKRVGNAEAGSLEVKIQTTLHRKNACIRDFLNPMSPVRRKWDVLIVGLVLFWCIVGPFLASISYESWLLCIAGDPNYTGYMVWPVLLYFSDMLYFLDYIAQFVTVTLVHGRAIVDAEMIAAYFRSTSRCYRDVASLIPWDLFAVAAGRADMLFCFASVRLLLRFPLLGSFLERYNQNIRLNRNLLDILRLFVYIMLATHWVACLWYGVGLVEHLTYGWSWLDVESMRVGPATDMRKYVLSLYWAMATMTTVGFGDILPSTTAEHFYTTLVMFFGHCMYAYAFGLMATLTGAFARRLEGNRRSDVQR